MAENSPTRRDKILEAALGQFLLNGLRGTSMEAIAKAAGVAKPTLYRYFPDKQALFEAIVAGLVGELREVAEKGLASPGTAAQRCAAALTAKHKTVFRLLENSPHAVELYEAPLGNARDALKALETWMIDEMTSAFAAEGRSDARALAQLLHAAADGVARHAKHAEEIGPATRLLAERLSAEG